MRLSEQEAADLLTHGDPIALGREADAERRRRFGDTVTFIVDRNINYTNICRNECSFCAFYRRLDAADAYLLPMEEILAKVGETAAAGGTQVMIQGGIHPDLPLLYYENMLRSIRERYPSIVIHSFTATEILYFAQKEGITVEDTLRRLQDAGLASLPGGGAEILVDRVRRLIAPKKIMTEEWLRVMRTAHKIGMESTATMVIGFGETMAERVEHMEHIRRLQEETGGFRAFITWTFQPGHTELGGEKASAWDYMRTLAVTRLYMDNVAHIQGSWVTQGERIGQLTLGFGADDLDGTIGEEKIIHAAGAKTGTGITKAHLRTLIKEAGYLPVERDTFYHEIPARGEKAE